MGDRWTWIPGAHCQDSESSAREQERQKRWAKLFDQLDLNKDGRIDIFELRTGLAGRGLSTRSLERVGQHNTMYLSNNPNYVKQHTQGADDRFDQSRGDVDRAFVQTCPVS